MTMVQATANSLFEFTVRAHRTRDDGVREGALIPCYAADAEYQGAVKKAIARLAGMGYAYDALDGKVREIDLAIWPEYVTKVWPDFADALPPPELVPGIVEGGGVFFGPLAGFDR